MWDDDIPPIARRQDGVFTAEQAIAAGWTANQVRHRRARGEWVRVAGRGLSLEREATAPRAFARAAQLTWPDAVACRTTAAGIHGFPVPPGHASAVLVGPGHRPSFRIHPHTATLGGGRTVSVSGLQTTDRLGTAIDCLAFLPLSDALNLYAWLSSRDEVRRDQLCEVVRGSTGRRGCGQLRQLLEATRSGAVSAAEHRMHELLRRARIRGWEAGVVVIGASGERAVADVLFAATRVILEVDGERAHAGRVAFVQDRRRQNDLVTAGFLVLRFTWWDLTERPDAVIRQIRSALNSRG